MHDMRSHLEWRLLEELLEELLEVCHAICLAAQALLPKVAKSSIDPRDFHT